MLLHRFYDEMLAQASYLLGCAATGEALIVDPARDIAPYVAAAADRQLRITHVAETHIHADFVSGARALAAHTGARLLVSGAGGEAWQYHNIDDERTTLLYDGSRFHVGHVRVDVLHTPGHTPEHLVFLVTDAAAADQPMGLFSGDLLFVGDVGRPDLLERAAHETGTMEPMARSLFASLARLRELPDWLQVWPGHGAGSACGKSLGAVPSTTLGYERRFNPALRIGAEGAFVDHVLRGQPEPPPYFGIMKQVNREGPPSLPARTPERLDALTLQRRLHEGALVVDTRSTADFAAGHVPGSIAVPRGASFVTYAGMVLPYDRDIVLVTGGAHAGVATELARQLARIGIDRVREWAGDDVLVSFATGGRRLATVQLVDAAHLSLRRDLRFIDVRGADEWDTGRIPGAVRIHLAELSTRARMLPHDLPLVLTCQTGSRAVVAASMLLAAGFTRVRSLAGGLEAWRAAGLPMEPERPAIGA